MADTPGSTTLDAEQRQWFRDHLGARYVAVADGSRGGHSPGRKYGSGKLAPSVKKRPRR